MHETHPEYMGPVQKKISRILIQDEGVILGIEGLKTHALFPSKTYWKKDIIIVCLSKKDYSRKKEFQREEEWKEL